MSFNPPDFWGKERRPKLKQLAVYDDWMMCQYVVDALRGAGFYAERQPIVGPSFKEDILKKYKGLYQPTCAVMVAENQYREASKFLDEWSSQL